jgi:pimeloyl-ACP methyl ester carboxylesterase
MFLLDGTGARVCTYDRAGTGSSDERPASVGVPTADMQADELHALLERADIEPPYILVPHSYGGLIARVFADRHRDEIAGFVFEDVSTAWEIDLWPKWDSSPWIDGGQRVDIQATEQQVLDAAPLGDLPSIVVSQATYEDEGIPEWAGPIFAKRQARLASLGTNVIHFRADGVGHFIHEQRPPVVAAAVRAVSAAARRGGALPGCTAVFNAKLGTCLS